MATLGLNSSNFRSTVEENYLVLVDFWAEWCEPCKKFSLVYEQASQRHAEVVFGKVDIEEARDVADAFDIMSIPTVLGFRGGKLVFQQIGSLSASQIDSFIEQLEDLDGETRAQQSK